MSRTVDRVITVNVDGVPFTKSQLAEALEQIEQAEKLAQQQYTPEVGHYFRVRVGDTDGSDVYLRIGYNTYLCDGRAHGVIMCVTPAGRLTHFEIPSIRAGFRTRRVVTFYRVESFDSPARV